MLPQQYIKHTILLFCGLLGISHILGNWVYTFARKKKKTYKKLQTKISNFKKENTKKCKVSTCIKNIWDFFWYEKKRYIGLHVYCNTHLAEVLISKTKCLILFSLPSFTTGAWKEKYNITDSLYYMESFFLFFLPPSMVYRKKEITGVILYTFVGMGKYGPAALYRSPKYTRKCVNYPLLHYAHIICLNCHIFL